MTSDPVIAVTAATGGLGSRVASRLAAAGAAQRLVVRDPDRAPTLPGAEPARADYERPEEVRAALTGVDTLLFVSATEHPDRIALHRNAIDAAVAAGYAGSSTPRS
jgi:NAD(P)H dehydrogenase (quinone)